MLGDLRQLFYPEELRIGSEDYTKKMLINLENVMEMAENSKPKTSKNKYTPLEKELFKVIVNMATGLWRSKTKLDSINDEDLSDESRLSLRNLENTLNVLEKSGFEIKDHTNTVYDFGMAVNVLTFQPMADIKQDIIIETVKPTVYYKNKIIQRGQVIVGKPETSDDENEAIK